MDKSGKGKIKRGGRMTKEMTKFDKKVDGIFSLLGAFCEGVAYHAAKTQVEFGKKIRDD